MMNKVDLEVKIESLKNMITEGQQQTSNYAGQLDTLNKKLEDLDKPEVTPMFLDKLSETITKVIENIDLDSGIMCDFEVDYNNVISVSDVQFEDTHAIADKIYCEVEKLFAEAVCPELDTTEDDNHPVERLQR